MIALHVQLVNSNLRDALKRLQFSLDVMVVCVRWYAAHALTLHNLEERMPVRPMDAQGFQTPRPRVETHCSTCRRAEYPGFHEDAGHGSPETTPVF
jgi:hypothetical protein